MSEMRAWYWKEEWADFRFWAPNMEWGVENTPSQEQYQEHVPDTPDSDFRKQRRIQSRPVKWFYESHYTRTGNFAGFQPLRFMQRGTNREVRWPDVINSAVQIQKSKPQAYVFKAIPEM